jgi:3-oxoacyl-[acyl-carrier-protein] synthase II
VTAAITGYESISCLGDAAETYAALLAGRTGVSVLREDRGDRDRLGVGYAYQIDEDAAPRRATDWLGRVVAGAAGHAGLNTGDQRVAVVVGTGLRELPTVERWSQDGIELGLHELHFAAAVRAALPGVTEVLTVSNACSASGYALAVGSDLLTAGEADAVIVAGCDAMTESMLAIIGRGSTVVTEAVRPFQVDRTGVLLGEGAAAVVLQPVDAVEAPLGLLRGVGLSCDAYHETAPDVEGIIAGMRDAHHRARVEPADIDLVLAHGTGTALNDPTEATALARVFGEAYGRAAVTAIKGATGHTSGAAALMSLIVALQSLHGGRVPAVAGLSEAIGEAAGLGLVTAARPLNGRLAQINAFGFGGVNAVAVVEVAA